MEPRRLDVTKSEEYTPPEVTVAGPGEPEVAVVGGVHGDETSSVRAVRRLRSADLDLQRGVAFVIANPDAVEAGERFLDSDLNRVFPGDPDGDHEERLAAALCDVIEPLTTLSLHDTHSQPASFALVHRSQPREYDLAADLPVERIVDHSGVNEGTITTCGTVVEIEVAPQGSDVAAEEAKRQAEWFLQRVGALPGDPPPSTPSFYQMADAVPKPPGATYELHVENFEYVPDGTVYARVDERGLVADEPFYPILMSECGYREIFGYRGDLLGESLSAAYEAIGYQAGTSD